MKSFFIVKNDLPRTNDEKFIVKTSDEKSGILEQLNVKGLDIDKYAFYDESKLDDENEFISLYHDSIFEVYFPRVKQANNTYVYYPKPKIVETPDGTIYVNKWNTVDVSGLDVSSMTYVCDDSEKEEYQRVLTIYNKKNSMEITKCE